MKLLLEEMENLQIQVDSNQFLSQFKISKKLFKVDSSKFDSIKHDHSYAISSGIFTFVTFFMNHTLSGSLDLAKSFRGQKSNVHIRNEKVDG